jgi:hypothetical protein
MGEKKAGRSRVPQPVPPGYLFAKFLQVSQPNSDFGRSQNPPSF